MYIIPAAHPLWKGLELENARALPDGFRYPATQSGLDERRALQELMALSRHNDKAAFLHKTLQRGLDLQERLHDHYFHKPGALCGSTEVLPVRKTLCPTGGQRSKKRSAVLDRCAALRLSVNYLPKVNAFEEPCVSRGIQVSRRFLQATAALHWAVLCRRVGARR